MLLRLLTSLGTAGFVLIGGPVLAHDLYLNDPICAEARSSGEMLAPVRRYCSSLRHKHSLQHLRPRLTEGVFDQWVETTRIACRAGYPQCWNDGLLIEHVLNCETELAENLLRQLTDGTEGSWFSR